MLIIQVSLAVGNLQSSLEGDRTFGWLCVIATFFLNPIFLYFSFFIRDKLSKMRPPAIGEGRKERTEAWRPYFRGEDPFRSS
jgi:hypothetical protein